MQAAGRLSSHTYADIRSARRSYQRTPKYPRKRPRDYGYCRCCFDIHYNEMRLARKKEVQVALKHEDWDDGVTVEGHWDQEHQETNELLDHLPGGDSAGVNSEQNSQPNTPLFKSRLDIEMDLRPVRSRDSQVDSTEDDWEVLSNISSDGWSVVSV